MLNFKTALYLMALSLALLTQSARADEGDFLNKDNWEGLDKYWTFDGKTIVGKTLEDPKFNTFLCSKQKYTDFELGFQVKLLGKTGNSGVQIRSEIVDKAKFVVKGPQADMGAMYWGSLYGEKMKEGMLKAANKEDVAKLLKKDEFNDYHIKVVGKHVTIKLNGKTMVDQDFEPLPDDGIIAWQIHAGQPMEVTFKDIKFTNLKK